MEDVLFQKIQVLHRGTAEQQLAGLCLSTRLIDDETFVKVFENSLDFCRALLQSHPNNPLFSRLVAQLVYRASGCANSLQCEGILNKIGVLIVPSLNPLHDKSELWTALRVLLSQIQNLDSVDSFLLEICRSLQTSTSTVSPNEPSPLRQDDSHDDSTQQLMDQTLAGLLEQTAIDCCSCEELFLENVLRIGQKQIPRFVETMLDDWMQASALDKRWYARVLLFALQNSKPQITTTTWKESVVKLILACIVSVDNDDDLRQMAWKSLLLTLHESGWEWILLPDNGRLGNYTKLCVVLRMAVGEFKIQLGKHLEQQKAGHSTTCALMEASGQFIVQAIDFIVEQDSINVEAITHIHKSLEESLQCCMEYLDMSMSEEIVVRVFSKLLSEIEVFEGKNETALRALRQAMEARHYELLLPALTTVFASAEGNNDRVRLLNKYDLILPMSGYLAQLFEEVTDARSVEWACQLIEIWMPMTQSSSEKPKTQSSLIQFLKRVLDDMNDSFSSAAVSAVIACYATLQGDKPPGDPDATILQTALERCS